MDITKQELPVEELMEKKYQFPYRGWDNIEQLEDVIGTDEATDFCLAEIDDKNVYYDLEITIKRVRRSDYKR